MYRVFRHNEVRYSKTYLYHSDSSVRRFNPYRSRISIVFLCLLIEGNCISQRFWRKPPMWGKPFRCMLSHFTLQAQHHWFMLRLADGLRICHTEHVWGTIPVLSVIVTHLPWKLNDPTFCLRSPNLHEPFQRTRGLLFMTKGRYFRVLRHCKSRSHVSQRALVCLVVLCSVQPHHLTSLSCHWSFAIPSDRGINWQFKQCRELESCAHSLSLTTCLVIDPTVIGRSRFY